MGKGFYEKNLGGGHKRRDYARGGTEYVKKHWNGTRECRGKNGTAWEEVQGDYIKRTGPNGKVTWRKRY